MRPSPRELSARESAVAERARPGLDAAGDRESNRDRRFVRGDGKTHRGRDEARDEARATLDVRGAAGHEAAPQVVHVANLRGQLVQGSAEQPRVQRRGDGVVARPRIDAPPSEQPLVVGELDLANRGARSRLRRAAVEQRANDGLDGHRRNHRAVVALREEVPRARDRAAGGVSARTATNMPPRCSPQRTMFVA